MDSKLLEIFNRFDVAGEALDIIPYGNGHINWSYLVKTDVRDYMLQTINTYVYKNVDSLMRNIYIVTNHLRSRGNTTLQVCKTLNKKIYVEEDGIYYRLYDFISNTGSCEQQDPEKTAEMIGRAFGEFHSELSDLDPILIAETIVNFHDTPKRYEALMDTAKRDEFGRLGECLPELNFIVENKAEVFRIMEGLNAGTIPQRIVHNDPKLDNVLFDAETGAVKCVIDLDTVMPGSCLFDYGDALRSLFTGDNESAADSSRLVFRPDIFRSLTKGYLSAAGKSLTPREVELLPNAALTLSMELGMRFLEDYINGDKYFRVGSEKQNLFRARNQLHLAKDLLGHMDDMDAIVKEYL